MEIIEGVQVALKAKLYSFSFDIKKGDGDVFYTLVGFISQ
jgi:hypothetical protein